MFEIEMANTNRGERLRTLRSTVSSRDEGAGCSRRQRASRRSSFVQTSYGNWIRFEPPAPKQTGALEGSAIAARSTKNKKKAREGRCQMQSLEKRKYQVAAVQYKKKIIALEQQKDEWCNERASTERKLEETTNNYEAQVQVLKAQVLEQQQQMQRQVDLAVKHALEQQQQQTQRQVDMAVRRAVANEKDLREFQMREALKEAYKEEEKVQCIADRQHTVICSLQSEVQELKMQLRHLKH